jgi:hypothetical protein
MIATLVGYGVAKAPPYEVDAFPRRGLPRRRRYPDSIDGGGFNPTKEDTVEGEQQNQRSGATIGAAD